MNKSLSAELKAFYDTELLESARQEMYYAQFAKRVPLPIHHNGKMEFRKWNTFDRVSKYTSGIIPTGQKFGVTAVEDDVICHEEKVEIDDMLSLDCYDDIIIGSTEEFGCDAAEIMEKLIRDTLLVNTNVLYCDNINIKAGEIISIPTSCREMSATGMEMSALTENMVNKAVAILKKNRVPRIGGKYYAVIHPSVASGLKSCEHWIEAHKYALPEEQFNGEIGELYGVRFIENIFAPVLDGEYANRDNTRTYATYFFGKDSFGISDPEGGSLEMIIHGKTEDTLPNKSTLGYRLETNGASIIYPERCLRVMSCSSRSDIDEANTDMCIEPLTFAEGSNVKLEVLRGKDREDPNVFVCINGINYLLPKGKTSTVPAIVHEEIYRASRAYDVVSEYKKKLNNG